jgi:anti-sigma regulatory factor (Ser/Thr protein kinase)
MIEHATNPRDLSERRRAAVAPAAYSIHPFYVARGEGSFIWDSEGNRYLDWSSGIAVMNIGHSHPRVVEAVKKQAETFQHLCFAVAMHESYIALCERLCELAPGPSDKRAFLINSGAEAVENAVDAQEDGGVIEIETGPADPAAREEPGPDGGESGRSMAAYLEVRDAGEGMNARVRDRIFEPFYSTKPRGQGTGLGMPTVLGLMKQLGGRVDVDSSPGRGTRVRVYFPHPERSGNGGSTLPDSGNDSPQNRT